ncbi:hypothetical protein BABINDRAFT_41668 [Babjeviella inositovora NRRL Y-12698]|uniref:Mitochondrial import inner membrane translocase subunit n=1 Tax=Babjeviella inositovora NRRL Y-12698 TaxID=984486 RepID=A0A1E3QI17_9ASCO|nr:uncharacterized protein BABINDRAFT_41668 [Babjeviella inositovora NRRL Y-12698]ODQ77280.1 hypothetical protein BABINDRAFT_41668 [Babjeviella inositovora NRRL Y-12698]
MSFFINQNNLSQLEVNQDKIKLAEIQFEAMSQTFNTIMYLCKEKCIPHLYGELELLKGEQICIDRCVAKYMTANRKVGELVQRSGLHPDYDMPAYQKVKKILEENQK